VPRKMIAIGMFYGDFSQVSDEQVREALGNARD
jgi:predicted phosphoribosyltransferase